MIRFDTFAPHGCSLCFAEKFSISEFIVSQILNIIQSLLQQINVFIFNTCYFFISDFFCVLFAALFVDELWLIIFHQDFQHFILLCIIAIFLFKHIFFLLPFYFKLQIFYYYICLKFRIDNQNLDHQNCCF